MRRKQKKWTSAAARRLVEFAGSPRTLELAVQITAERLLDGLKCPPVDLESLQTRLGVESAEPIDGLPISGELRKVGQRLKIVYAASLSPGRRRFTIAHELAHAVFEATGAKCPRYGEELEQICDMLAGEFLMPRRIFAQRAGSNIDPSKIFALAREFDTSVMATAVRCRQLFGVSVFQVEDARLAWGYGAIRTQGDIQRLQLQVEKAMEGKSGEQSLSFGSADQLLQWVSAPRQRRALFVLQPNYNTKPQFPITEASFTAASRD